MANSHVDLLSLCGSVKANLDVDRERERELETKVELLFRCANNVERRVIGVCQDTGLAGSKPARVVTTFSPFFMIV